MSVAIATKVFGSEVLVAVIRHCHSHPLSSQSEIAESLDLPHQLISTSVRLLKDAGVLVVSVRGAGRRPSRYSADMNRYDELLNALRQYGHGA